ncbi:unnamed protein product [Nesidiocoris tenuis]|uniref:Uncharacterized protein n=1 Tax=Nesidiocoris tenuis TaxID=355587 RepID=A0A6H5GZ90_9HEMI|nr:unnamed protein product [Nesidiocoris tenuis]
MSTSASFRWRSVERVDWWTSGAWSMCTMERVIGWTVERVDRWTRWTVERVDRWSGGSGGPWSGYTMERVDRWSGWTVERVDWWTSGACAPWSGWSVEPVDRWSRRTVERVDRWSMCTMERVERGAGLLVEHVHHGAGGSGGPWSGSTGGPVQRVDHGPGGSGGPWSGSAGGQDQTEKDYAFRGCDSPYQFNLLIPVGWNDNICITNDDGSDGSRLDSFTRSRMMGKHSDQLADLQATEKYSDKTFNDSRATCLIPLRHQEFKMRPWQTEFEIRFHQAEISRISIQSMDADDQMKAIR